MTDGFTDNRIFRFDFTEGKERLMSINNKQVNRGDRAKATEKRVKTQTETLTAKERKFCREYVKTGKAGQSVMNAGYNCSNLNSAGVQATDLLKKPKIQNEIKRLEFSEESEAIATSQEVMSMLTRIARGEDKDQFGLEISASDRIKAMVELAKRTVDIDNKVKLAQSGDNAITIKLDWGQDTAAVAAPSLNLNLDDEE